MGACRTVPQVRYLTQVLRQVVLVVSLIGQLQVATERVQPHWISPAEAESGHYSVRLTVEQIARTQILKTFLPLKAISPFKRVLVGVRHVQNIHETLVS